MLEWDHSKYCSRDRWRGARASETSQRLVRLRGSQQRARVTEVRTCSGDPRACRSTVGGCRSIDCSRGCYERKGETRERARSLLAQVRQAAAQLDVQAGDRVLRTALHAIPVIGTRIANEPVGTLHPVAAESRVVEIDQSLSCRYKRASDRESERSSKRERRTLGRGNRGAYLQRHGTDHDQGHEDGESQGAP